MDFPKLQPGQYAVAAAEVRTGIALRLDYKWRRADESAERWRGFDSLAAAREFAVAGTARNPEIEFWIYDKKDHPVERIAAC